MERDENIVIKIESGTAFITLNRPEALNALSFDMVIGLRGALASIEKDDDVNAVLITGAGGKAFCAGGDIKAAYREGPKASIFFVHEYSMNRELFHFSKPLVSLADGIVMGGGFGVAGPCRYTVVTEKTVFAMPEVSIGFFPDIGSMYYLSRCPGTLGLYLAMTGTRLSGAQMCAAGLATHYMTRELATSFECEFNVDSIEALLSEYSRPPPTAPVLPDAVEACFLKEFPCAILDALDHCEEPEGPDLAVLIRNKSPTSVMLAFAYFNWAKGRTFDEITAMDYLLSEWILEGHDFYEGVRALLIDKDHKPQWNPAGLDNIDPQIFEDLLEDFSGRLDRLDFLCKTNRINP